VLQGDQFFVERNVAILTHFPSTTKIGAFPLDGCLNGGGKSADSTGEPTPYPKMPDRPVTSYSLGDRMDVVEEAVKLPLPSPNNTVIVPSLRFETARSK